MSKNIQVYSFGDRISQVPCDLNPSALLNKEKVMLYNPSLTRGLGLNQKNINALTFKDLTESFVVENEQEFFFVNSAIKNEKTLFDSLKRLGDGFWEAGKEIVARKLNMPRNDMALRNRVSQDVTMTLTPPKRTIGKPSLKPKAPKPPRKG
jgi:hypothetical protein